MPIRAKGALDDMTGQLNDGDVLYRLAGDAEGVAPVKALGRIGDKEYRFVTDHLHVRDARTCVGG